MKIKNIILCMPVVLLLASCSSKRDTLTYFQDLNYESFEAPVNLSEIEPKIEPFDELIIAVSSLQPELSAPYNLPIINPASSQKGFVASGAVQQATYFVSAEGTIEMPMLGTVKAAGLTTEQLADVLVEKISKDIDDPTVVVTMVNFKIDVAGEVANPGRYTITGKRMSILDAISQAGDLTPFGEREKVILIREEDGKRVAYNIDLTKSDILTSPYFFLKQNDYIYVSPNMIRKDNAKYNQNNAYKLSVISTIVSASSVIASLVIALTIK